MYRITIGYHCALRNLQHLSNKNRVFSSLFQSIISLIVTLYCFAIFDNVSPFATVCELVVGFTDVDGVEGFTPSFVDCFESQAFELHKSYLSIDYSTS